MSALPRLALACAAALAPVSVALADPMPCAPEPARMVVLGDSIVDCYGVGGELDDRCGPKQLHDWLNANYARGVTYENLSESGATTSTLVRRQLPTVPTGPGHVLVVIYIGGNDLYPYVYMPENVAVAAWPDMEEELQGYWEEIFAFFEDTRSFPDGATIVLNTQYNPFDDCYGTSPGKIQVLKDYNAMLAELAAGAASRHAADPYAPFLGHGHNYQRNTCPYYERGNEYWMNDLIHPNELGHQELAGVWEDLLTPLYEGCF